MITSGASPSRLQHGSTVTRKTRMIFVQEISDTSDRSVVDLRQDPSGTAAAAAAAAVGHTSDPETSFASKTKSFVRTAAAAAEGVASASTQQTSAEVLVDVAVKMMSGEEAPRPPPASSSSDTSTPSAPAVEIGSKSDNGCRPTTTTIPLQWNRHSHQSTTESRIAYIETSEETTKTMTTTTELFRGTAASSVAGAGLSEKSGLTETSNNGAGGEGDLLSKNVENTNFPFNVTAVDVNKTTNGRFGEANGILTPVSLSTTGDEQARFENESNMVPPTFGRKSRTAFSSPMTPSPAAAASASSLSKPRLPGRPQLASHASAVFPTGVGRAPKAMLQDHADGGASDLQSITDSLLYAKLHPILVCMSAVGIFYVRRPRRTHGHNPFQLLRNSSPLQIYCGGVVVALVLNFARSLTVFGRGPNDFDDTLFFKLMIVISFYESASRSVLANVACRRRKNGLQTLFHSIDRTCYPDGIIPYEQSLRFWVRAFLALTLVLGGLNVSMTAYGMFAPADIRTLFDLYLSPVPVDVTGVLAFKIFVLALTVVNSCVAILSLAFFTVICYVLYKEFEYLCRTFAMKIRDDGAFGDDLERFRIRHQRRCKLVEETDQIFKYYIANTYMTNLPLICLLLYTVVYSKDYQMAHRIISSVQCTYVTIQMMIMSIIAIMINTKVCLQRRFGSVS